jgi:subfamily B ATP-binding cassette protein MsbA
MTRLLRQLLRPYRPFLLIVFVTMLAQTMANLASPWPLKVVLDNVVGTRHLPAWLADLIKAIAGGDGRMHIATMAAVSAVLIAIVGAVSSYVANYYTESVGQWVAHDLRMRTYHHLQRLSLRYYETHQAGAILSTLTTDIGTIQSFASSGTMGMVVDLFTIVGMLGLMFWLNWDFALIAIAVAPILLLLLARVKKAVKEATKEVRRNQSEIVTIAEQSLQSEREIKAYGAQDLEESRLEAISRSTVDSALRARKVKAVVTPAVSITVAICVAGVLWRGAYLILAGMMTAGVLTIFLSYLNRFFKPVQDLAKMTTAIAQTAVGVDRIRAILDADTLIPESPQAQEPASFGGEITFEHVRFSYQADAPVLRDVTFTIRSGQMVGIVGPTGSGKSTVISLIPRFYDPSEGRVLIDGVDIRDYTLQGLRRQVGFVLQETVLFHGTVAENIAYGKPGATEREIIEAAKLANADEFIVRMPDGYDTMVGDRGLTLSGGQRQRIGIARAIIRNNPILILDEPTAALDTESEARVVEALQRLMKGRTVIMIAHRLSTIRGVDKIIVLKGGVVAEEGSHEELLAREHIYADLYRAQFAAKAARVEV